MLRTLCGSICRDQMWKVIRLPQGYCTAVAESLKDDSTDLSCYLKFESKILKVINEGNLMELKRYTFPTYAAALISQREAKGPYNSIQHLFSYNELEPHVIKRICSLIMQEETRAKGYKYRVTPVMEAKVPETILGLHVGPTVVSWALIDKNFQVVEWNYTTWSGDMPGSISYNLIKLISTIVERIPMSTVYVMEEPIRPKKVPRNILQNMQLQQQLMIAIMTCVALRKGKSDLPAPKHNVYILHTQTTARLFNLLIRSEVISTEYAMETIDRNIIKTSTTEDMNVHLNDETKLLYTQATCDEQEQMSWSLLKALTFLRLALLRSNSKKRSK